jgi:NTP pyrophosphatase (non-canonical NTP hydrolase)
MTIQEAQEAVDNWINTYGVRYFNELTNMAILTEEMGEVARIIARSYGEQSTGKSGEEQGDLADELSDVLFVLICLANQTGIDLEKAFRKNLKKKTARDFERHQQNDKLKYPRS